MMNVDMVAMTAAAAAASKDQARDLLRCVLVSVTDDGQPIYTATDTYVATMAMAGDIHPGEMLALLEGARPVALFPAADVVATRKAAKAERKATLDETSATLSCGVVTIPSSLPDLQPDEYPQVKNLFLQPERSNVGSFDLATKPFGKLLACINEPAKFWPMKERSTVPFSLFFQTQTKPALFASVVPNSRVPDPVSVLGLIMPTTRNSRVWS